MTALYDSADHYDMFQMDDIDQPFEMDDDYGFYEEIDADDNTVAPMPIPFDSDEESTRSIPVCGSRIEDENEESLLSSPPILTPSMVDTIAEDGLPWSMQEMQWERLFASSRDGTSFGTFMRRVRGHDQTIIVAKTSDGKIVGGYATDVWSGRKQSASSQDGADQAFLFVVEPPVAKTEQATTPMANSFIPGLGQLGTSPTSAFDFDFHHLSLSSPKHQEDRPSVEIIKPSQKQDANAGLKQACQIGNKFISMSDGNGDLSLVIENSFSRGGVVRTKEGSEEFDVVEFEVYGFSED